MSQKKVDAYKARKANREKILKKEKQMQMLEKIAGAIVCIAVIAWMGFSVYGKVSAPKETTVAETIIDTSALDECVADLSSTETVEEVEE